MRLQGTSWKGHVDAGQINDISMRSGRKENGDTEIDIVDVGTDSFIICMLHLLNG